jgi:Ca-activated chloride channel family protein
VFRFEHIDYFYGLLAIPILVVFIFFLRKKENKYLLKMGVRKGLERLMPSRNTYKYWLKWSALLLSFIFVLVAAANPQWGGRKEKRMKRGVDIFVALDISQSMMAEDIRPNRLERAKAFTQRLVEEFRSDRLGFIIFAGQAYLQMPLTTDFSAMQLMVKSANPQMISVQGTAIGQAIQVAAQNFDKKARQSKILVVISDGEDHEEGAIKAARNAKEQGITVFTIGVGTSTGSPIPVVSDEGIGNYLRDKEGNLVQSKLNEIALEEIVQSDKGRYFNINDGATILSTIKKHLDTMEQEEIEQENFNASESYYQYFLAPAILLLLIEFLMSYRKNSLFS